MLETMDSEWAIPLLFEKITRQPPNCSGTATSLLGCVIAGRITYPTFKSFKKLPIVN
jgi:hypothetical protein